VDWGDTEPFFIGGTWNCVSAQDPSVRCPDFAKLKIQRNAAITEEELQKSKDTATDNRSGKLMIQPNAFPAKSSWMFTITITKGYECAI
jgi:hypothetical protein